MLAKKNTKKPTIGVCGGIGSGKSLVAEILSDNGCLVISSDKLGHDALELPEAIAQIVAWWGSRVLTPEGKPDRSEIARIVFSDPVEKKKLESLIHPLIAEKRVSMIHSVESQPAVKAIVLDSPLLFESKLDRLCDAIIFVHSPEAQRLERVTRNRGWGKEEFQRRESQQLSLEQKRSQAHYIIENIGSRESLRASVQEVLKRILADAPTHRP